MDKRERLNSILTQNFSLEVYDNHLDTESEYLKKIQQALAIRIEYFINTDVDKLLHILYTIDVDQRLTDQAFELGEIKKISFKLAEHIIARQLRKIDYAKEFYQKNQ